MAHLEFQRQVDGPPFLGVLHGYCDTEDCLAREIEVQVKNPHRENCPAMRCPLCGQLLGHQRAEPAEVERERREREARMSVNMQRYRRDHGPIMPVSVFLDDRLSAEPWSEPT